MQGQPFLTGSRAYGHPHEASDTDVVMLIEDDDQLINALMATADTEGSQLKGENGKLPAGGISLCFGPLNLIIFTKKEQYDLWREVQTELEARAPVSRSEACEALRSRLGF